MTRKTSIIEQVGSFFALRGKVLTADEYKTDTEAPVRFQLVKRTIGSWSRVLNMVGDIRQYEPLDVTIKTEVHDVTDVEEVKESVVETDKQVELIKQPTKVVK